MANNIQKAALITGGIVIAGMVVVAGLVIAVAGAILAPLLAIFGRKRVDREEPQQPPTPKGAIDVSFERLDK